MAQTFSHVQRPGGSPLAWASYLTSLDQATARVDELKTNICELVRTGALAPLTTALQAQRGVQLVTGVRVSAEIGDFARF